MLSLGKLTCGVEQCDNVELILYHKDQPVSLRTLGKLLDQKRLDKIDDSQVEFERSSNNNSILGSNTCNLHGQVITHVNGSLKSGCDRCLDRESSHQQTVQVTKLNIILIEEGQIVSRIKEQGRKMVSQLRSTNINLEKENKMLNAEKKKVTDYFDRLHNSLELREFQVVGQIVKEQKESLKAIDDLHKSVYILEELLEMVNDHKINPRSLQSDGQINLAQVVKTMVEEEGKAKTLLQDIEARSPNKLSIDPNFFEILKSCIYVEDTRVKVDSETPPESSNEDEGDGNRVLNKLKEVIKDNSTTQEETSPESSCEDERDEAELLNRLKAVIKVNSTSPDESPIQAPSDKERASTKVSKRVDFDLDSSIDTTIPAGGIIDIDNSSDSEDEEDSVRDHSSILTTSVPRFHKVECEVLKVISPSNITVMSFEDREAFRRLQSDLNNFFQSREDKNSLDKTLHNGDTIAVKTNNHGWVRAMVVKTDKQVHLDLIDLGLVYLMHDVSDVRPLASQFLKVPRLAFNVKLENLIPIGCGNKWSIYASDKLKQLFEEASTVEIEVNNKS